MKSAVGSPQKGTKAVRKFGSSRSPQRFPFRVRRNPQSAIELEANYEFAQQKFKELNPYRPAEFTRDWNVNRNVNDVGIVTRPTDEHLFNGGAPLRTPKRAACSTILGASCGTRCTVAPSILPSMPT
ncbi:MAG: hypothetical protein IPM82_05085 [Saprospiraceae bacterium]|nr:hypothetical protein [Saprospiraceae bacterium]